MRTEWKRAAIGVYKSDLCTVMREAGGWCAFRVSAPTFSESGFSSRHAATRWAEANVPAMVLR